jgi:Coenzyme PQQ synthesis protein D (PqqD)
MMRGPMQVGGVDIHEVADGYVVYQPDRDRVHYLNHTAALVLEFCTGDNSIDDIAGILQAAFELPALPDEQVEECLEVLRDEGLIN